MLTLNDGRSELWQWDTNRKLTVDADCSQVHFSNKVFGRSIDVDVVNGIADIPDALLQTDKELNVWAFVGTAENGYTKISKTFKVNRRNKPADYVFTPPDQTTLAELVGRLDKIEESQDPDAIKNAVEDYLQQNPVEVPVQSVNGQTGAVELNAEDVGAIAKTELPTAINTALAQAKASGEFDGADGAPGKDGADGQPGENGADGYSPTANVTQNDNGATITITDKNGTTTATVTNGKDGADGNPGADGIPGKDGADGKSAYQYAQDGGYTGTEEAFAEKLAQEPLIGTTNDLTPTQVYEAVSAGIPVKVQYTDSTYGLSSFTAFNVSESMNVIASNAILNYQNTYLLAALYGDKSINGWLYEVTPLAKPSDIPSALPNPKALTFTGAVTGRYDGSAPLNVKIPSAVTDDHINSLIDAKLGVIENGSY